MFSEVSTLTRAVSWRIHVSERPWWRMLSFLLGPLRAEDGFLMGRRKHGAIKQRKKTMETFRVTHVSHILKFEIIDHMKVIFAHASPNNIKKPQTLPLQHGDIFFGGHENIMNFSVASMSWSFNHQNVNSDIGQQSRFALVQVSSNKANCDSVINQLSTFNSALLASIFLHSSTLFKYYLHVYLPYIIVQAG